MFDGSIWSETEVRLSRKKRKIHTGFLGKNECDGTPATTQLKLRQIHRNSRTEAFSVNALLLSATKTNPSTSCSCLSVNEISKRVKRLPQGDLENSQKTPKIRK